MTVRPPRQITCGPRVYEYLKPRFAGGWTYASCDRAAYLRAGAPSDIERECAVLRDLHAKGFAVPEQEGHGRLSETLSFFVEESIGDLTLGQVFVEDTRETGRVRGGSIDRYTTAIGAYLSAQCRWAESSADHGWIETALLLDNVRRNCPLSDRVSSALERALRTLEGWPICPSQSDLNAFNVFDDGVIDFELATMAPVGMDVVTSIVFGRYWPSDRRLYQITDDQVERFLAAMDRTSVRHGMRPVTERMNEFLFMKAVWATARDAVSDAYPGLDADLWAWRRKLCEWSAQEYLSGRMIDTGRFTDI